MPEAESQSLPPRSLPALRVLLVTSEWPVAGDPHRVPFLVQNVKFLQAAGAEVEVFHFRGSKSPLNYLKAWHRLRQTHDLRRYDLIHGHFGQSGLVGWPAPVPLVMTFHGSDLQGIVLADGSYSRASGPLRKMSRFAARKARENIVVSRKLLDFLPPLCKPAHVIPLGVDFERFSPIPRDEARRRLELPLDKKLVLFAASPTNAVKRFDLAQAAMAKLAWPDAELITLTGKSHDIVPLYMSACDALLLTSRHEGSPTVVKEALICDLPVVTTEVGDVRERLENVPGNAICEDEPEALAVGLKQVLASPGRLQARAQLAELDERRVAQRILEVYDMALGR
jgi:glycosyltransferase involved in cell wall biosynthesis